MVVIFKEKSRDLRRVYERHHGMGIGSFLKSAASSVKSSLKEVAKVAVSKGKDVARAAGSHLKDAAKATLKTAVASGKELVKEAGQKALQEGMRIGTEALTNVVVGLAEAKSLEDVGTAMKKAGEQAAKDFKDTSKTIAKDTVADAKQRGINLAKEGILNTILPGRASDVISGELNPLAKPEPENDYGAEEEPQDDVPIEDGGRLTIKNLLEGRVRKPGSKRKRMTVGGAIYLPS